MGHKVVKIIVDNLNLFSQPRVGGGGGGSAGGEKYSTGDQRQKREKGTRVPGKIRAEKIMGVFKRG
jgi:hypothetical protein